MKIILIELNLWFSTATYQSVLTSFPDFFLLSEIATIWQTDSIAHKLKPRLFHKSASPSQFYRLSLWYELCPILVHIAFIYILSHIFHHS